MRRIGSRPTLFLILGFSDPAASGTGRKKIPEALMSPPNRLKYNKNKKEKTNNKTNQSAASFPANPRNRLPRSVFPTFDIRGLPLTKRWIAAPESASVDIQQMLNASRIDAITRYGIQVRSNPGLMN